MSDVAAKSARHAARALSICTAAVLGVLSFPHLSRAELVLITAEEAALPDSPDVQVALGGEASTEDDETRGGIVPPPQIRLVSPTTPEAIRGNFRLRIAFQAFGGASVDENSIRIVYMKQPEIDLTDRVSGYVTPEGIDVRDVIVPPGHHVLQMEAMDSEMRSRIVVFELEVKP